MTPNVPFSRPGAVDLSKLAKPPTAKGSAGAADGGGAGGPGAWVLDVGEQDFQTEVIERSSEVPVLVDFWADWCQPCKQLSPILERLSDEYGGRFVLAKVDVEAEQRLAQAAQVQSIPLVLAVLAGQAIPLFNGALPEEQVRQAIEQVLQAAEANGVNGRAQPVNAPVAAPPDQPVRDPRYAEADDALESGDVKGAIAGYEKILDQNPADVEAKHGLALARLMERTTGVDADAVRAAGARDAGDPAAQCAVADLEMIEGSVDDAFGRLLGLIRRTSGAERDAIRVHLLDLFEVVGGDDPRVHRARQRLSAALF